MLCCAWRGPADIAGWRAHLQATGLSEELILPLHMSSPYKHFDVQQLSQRCISFLLLH